MSKIMFTSSQDAEAAFYEALEHANLDAMMQLWAEDDEISCVQPGGPRLIGYAAIREAWARIFKNAARLRVSISDLTVVQTPFAAVHTLIETISVVGDDTTHAPVVATNVYVRGPLGWRLLVHHASPAPPGLLAETPKILH